jgi:hypothetical protein
MIAKYKIIVLLSGILGIYARYNFVQVFKEDRKEHFRYEKLAFLLFYITLYCVYFKFDIPIANLLVQLFFFIAIGILNELSFKKILLNTSMVILVIVAIDSIIFFMTGYVSESVFMEVGDHSLFGIIATDMITLLVSVIFKNYTNINKNINLPSMYWVTVFTFPIISLALMIIVFEHNSKKPTIVIISTTIIFMMNLIVFWLYDKMIVLFEKRLDEIVARQLNISYRKQLEMMRSSIISSKSFKHDIRRHIVTMKTLIDDKRYSEINDYIKEMDDAIKSEQMVSNTGNLVLDSVINFEINSSGIESSLIVFTATNIPNEMNIKDYDLTVVISNVVSNALLAVKKISDGKVEIDLQYRKGIFFIRINNDFDGRILLKDDEIITTKQDTENHGYGLKNVKATVDKYDGELKIEYDNRIFRLETMMYEKN